MFYSKLKLLKNKLKDQFYFFKTQKISIIEWITYDKNWKTLWQKEKLHVLCNFFLCHYVFKKPSATEASESVYMRERVNKLHFFSLFLFLFLFVKFFFLLFLFFFFLKTSQVCCFALSMQSPGSSIGSDAGCQSKGCEFEPQLGQHSFRRLTKVTVTSVIRLSQMG